MSVHVGGLGGALNPGAAAKNSRNAVAVTATDVATGH